MVGLTYAITSCIEDLQSQDGIFISSVHAKPDANRKNCINNFDQKNVAQYAYGLVALGHQLFSLGLSDIPKVDPHNNIADALRDMYQNMGDALALQYGGSTTHNTVFLERYGRETLTLGVGF